MKRTNRFSALVLAVAMLFTLTTTACAAEPDEEANASAPITIATADTVDTGFTDVSADAWYAEAVIYCREHNLMAGTGNNRFDPDGNLTRAQLATVLYRIEGTPSVTGSDNYSDTPDGAWYNDAVLWASQQNLMGGYGGGLFGPNDPVSREQMTTILWRYAGSPAVESASDYSDETSIASYASAAVDWSSVNHIVAPTANGVFSPKNNASRAQVASALMNYDRQQTGTEPVPAPTEGSRVLVAYFSATGNTETVANHIKESLNADLYEIVPEQAYTSADLNYSNSSSRSQVEQRDASARPAITGSVENMSAYNVVFVGYPIWNGQAPRIISTFLESYDFTGKTIVPFCTSGGSGIGSSATSLHSLVPNATWLDGNRFSGGASRSTVDTWVNGLDLPVAEETTVATGEPNILIAYFSWSGNTELLANEIQQQTGGILFEIVPADPYPEDYNATGERWHQERDADARPEIAGTVENMEDYLPCGSDDGGGGQQHLQGAVRPV